MGATASAQDILTLAIGISHMLCHSVLNLSILALNKWQGLNPFLLGHHSFTLVDVNIMLPLEQPEAPVQISFISLGYEQIGKIFTNTKNTLCLLSCNKKCTQQPEAPVHT